MTMLDPHLDVDQLSAAVDGVADAATSAHLLSCLACREQVELWRRSLGQLRDLAIVESDTDAPSASAVDAAINAALDAWTPPAAPSASASGESPSPEVSSPAGSDGSPAGSDGSPAAGPTLASPVTSPTSRPSSARPSSVRPASSRPPSSRPPSSPATARARRLWRRPPKGLISAAAVLIVVVGGFIGAIQLARTGGSGVTSGASSSAAGSGASGTSGSSSASKASSASGSTGSSGASGSTGSGGTAASSSSNGSLHQRTYGSPTGSPTFSANGKAKLAADLKRFAVETATYSKVRASTPCLKEAKAAAEAAANHRAPSFLVPVRYRGIETRAFVFARDGGYVAFVLRDATCAVVTRVDF